MFKGDGTEKNRGKEFTSAPGFVMKKPAPGAACPGERSRKENEYVGGDGFGRYGDPLRLRHGDVFRSAPCDRQRGDRALQVRRRAGRASDPRAGSDKIRLLNRGRRNIQLNFTEVNE